MLSMSMLLAAAVTAAVSAHAVATVEPVPGDRVQMSRVKLSTGVELQVAQAGDPAGEPVLFLHGYTDSWFSFSTVLDRLPAGVRAIVPSQRGHGDSQHPACCYRLSDFAADAVAVLDALNVPRATVVGHSMGSLVAQRVAIDRPDRVIRLMLIGSGTTARVSAVLEFNTEVQKLSDPVAVAFVRDFQQSSIARPVPAAFMDGVLRESAKVPARVWRDALAGLLAPDAANRLDRIGTDTLIVWGDQDAFWPRSSQEELQRAIPAARLITYPGVGHSPQWEDPDRFAADLEAFVRPAAGSRSPAEHQEHAGHAHGKATGSGVMPLLTGFGTWHHRITTTSPEAQRYFDQGLRLTYGFNHEEAVRSFERAVELDAGCAMCHWGVAYALGPNINLPMDAKVEPRALAAITRAVSLKAKVTAGERALIEAMAVRYAEPAGAARAERDKAYADAMRVVAQKFPSDIDAQTLFADAMLNLRPWNQWTRNGAPQPGTLELVAALERALARQPNHAGACHFYIHAVEASDTPERALPCAERLPKLMPGAGHVVHMPAHVYLRVGRYEAAARANIAAVEADRKYFAEHHAAVPGIYPMFYAPHNLHFLWSAYLLSGQREKALTAARALAERVKLEDAKATVSLEAFLPPAILTLARFGQWDAVLAEPAPPAELRYATAMWHYARGLAFSARQQVGSAESELQKVKAIGAGLKEDVIVILNPAPVLLRLAAEVLAGDISARQRRFDEAIARFRAAAQIEDGLTYDEPPPWYHTVRNMLGETLLAAGKPAEAAAAFTEDLRYMRETGWSLSGLERALRAEGKTQEADAVARRLKAAWKYADSSVAAGRPAEAGGHGVARKSDPRAQ